VLEDGKCKQSEVGTVQGGSISPLLANIYLHYGFDLWVHQWRKSKAQGDVVVVRFADDCVVGFEHREVWGAVFERASGKAFSFWVGTAGPKDALD
jgi:RNA-directed DNA polymerase